MIDRYKINRDYEQLRIRLYRESQKNAKQIIEDKRKESWLKENSWLVNDDEYLIIMYRYRSHADGWYVIVTTYYDDEIGPFKSEAEAKKAIVKLDDGRTSFRFVYYGSFTSHDKFDVLADRII